MSVAHSTLAGAAIVVGFCMPAKALSTAEEVLNVKHIKAATFRVTSIKASVSVLTIAGPTSPESVAKSSMGRAMRAARMRILAAGEKLTPAKDLMEALDNSRLRV